MSYCTPNSMWRTVSLQNFSNGKLVFTASPELLALLFNKGSVSFHVITSRNHKIEFRGFVAEKLAVNPRPNKAAVGSYIYFGNSKANRLREFIVRNAARRNIHCAAGAVNSAHFLGWHGRSSV